jgi:hypothetical protein
MTHLPINGRRAFVRSPQLPAFLLPAQPLPPALPRSRKHRRYATISLGECGLLAVLALSLGIAAGAVTRLPVPSLPASVETQP